MHACDVKNYSSSNRHDPCGDILMTEARIEELADTVKSDPTQRETISIGKVVAFKKLVRSRD